MEGWIKIHSKMLDWEWYTDIPVKVLFMHCLLKANWQERKWRGEVIERGSFLTSLNELSVETGLSVQQIRTAFDKLKSTNEINIQSTSRNTIVTVCRYDSYQCCGRGEQQTDNIQITNEQQTSNNNRRSIDIEERKNNINIIPKKETFDFRQELLNDGVPESVADEWMLIRKRAKAANTETAYKALRREADRAGIPIPTAVTISVERSWRGFNASWLRPDEIPTTPVIQQPISRYQ